MNYYALDEMISYLDNDTELSFSTESFSDLVGKISLEIQNECDLFDTEAINESNIGDKIKNIIAKFIDWLKKIFTNVKSKFLLAYKQFSKFVTNMKRTDHRNNHYDLLLNFDADSIFNRDLIIVDLQKLPDKDKFEDAMNRANDNINAIIDKSYRVVRALSNDEMFKEDSIVDRANEFYEEFKTFLEEETKGKENNRKTDVKSYASTIRYYMNEMSRGNYVEQAVPIKNVTKLYNTTISDLSKLRESDDDADARKYISQNISDLTKAYGILFKIMMLQITAIIRVVTVATKIADNYRNFRK